MLRPRLVDIARFLSVIANMRVFIIDLVIDHIAFRRNFACTTSHVRMIVLITFCVPKVVCSFLYNSQIIRYCPDIPSFLDRMPSCSTSRDFS